MKDVTESIIHLTQELIKIPSQGGVDTTDEILSFIFEWATSKKMICQYLVNEKNKNVAILIEISGSKNSPIYCLNACADTAPVGNMNAWNVSPFSADIRNGWLYGRGSADSKIAIAIFLYIAEHIYQKKNIKGSLHILFDGDEHTGKFGGIKSYINLYPTLKGVIIGYPGNNHLNIGARGFYRARIEVNGSAAHSGDINLTGNNAILKASKIVQALNELRLPDEQKDIFFKFGPRLTVTGIKGGQGYSIIPDLCNIFIDCRLTPGIGKMKIKKVILETLKMMDEIIPSEHPSRLIDENESWPAYRLNQDSNFVKTIGTAASKYFEHNINEVVVGPSNIGNYLAKKGIEATCGFGVSYKNIHGANERIEISTITPVYLSYWKMILSVFKNLNRQKELKKD